LRETEDWNNSSLVGITNYYKLISIFSRNGEETWTPQRQGNC